MIDLRWLQMFVAAYDARSYTAAAHRLGYTRQNIAYGISQLGRQAGGPLFSSTVRRKGVYPTPTADDIIQAARQAVEAAEACQRVLSGANSKKDLT